MPGKFPEGDRFKKKRQNRYMKGGKVHFHSYENLDYEMATKVSEFDRNYYYKLVSKVFDVIKNTENAAPITVNSLADECKISLELTIIVVTMLQKSKVVHFDSKNFIVSQLLEKSDER